MRHRLVFFLCVFFLYLSPGFAQVILPYQPVSGMKTSDCYSVQVNGQDIWVEEIGPGGMENLNVANFSGEGQQDICITVDDTIENFTIQPESKGVRATAAGNKLYFTISGPGQLYVKVNENPYLAVFANPLEQYDISPDQKNVDYYAPGNYDIGRIDVRDNQVIYIAGGANVKADIYGSAKNLKILGRGSLDGRISLNHCENLIVDGIFIRNTRGWANTITDSRSSLYNNVKIFSHTGVWGLDGINPVSCKGFDIKDCFIRTRDDCIAIKSNGNPEKFDLTTSDINIEGCILVGWDHADGVTLGFELNGGEVKNVRVSDCDILRSAGSGRSGGHSAFSIVCDGESYVHDILFEDIRVENDMEYKNMEIILTEGERYGNGKMGSIDGVHIKNVKWANVNRPFTIVGHPTRFVKNILFTNCYVGGKLITGLEDAWFQTEYVSGLKFVPGGDADVIRFPDEEFKSRVPGQRSK